MVENVALRVGMDGAEPGEGAQSGDRPPHPLNETADNTGKIDPMQSSSLPVLGPQLLSVSSPSEETTLEMPYIFKSVQSTLNQLCEAKLIMFKLHLTHNYAEYFKGQLDYYSDVLDVVDKMLERCGRGGALNITLRILQDIQEYDLAKALGNTCKRTRLQYDLKTLLKRKYDCIFEGIARAGQQTFLSCVYIDQYMTVDGNVVVNSEHEVRQTEVNPRNQGRQRTAIPCSDIFKRSSGQYTPIRSVLTTGIAGIGLTVCVQRFILDWTEKKANSDIHFVFPFPCRELSLVKEEYISLMDLICTFFPDMKEMDFIEKRDCKVLFILDGLDDCKIPLNFQENDSLSDINKPTTTEVLITNLIRGNMLPSALVWITCRSAAASWIPSKFVHRCTELLGFNDEQKEAYFTKKFKDPTQLRRVLTHVTSSKTLHIMCHIPVFCWIVATVLESKFADAGREVTATLTQFYTHYLTLQMHVKNQKYYGLNTIYHQWLNTDQEFVLKLAKFAFEQLEKDRFTFYETDLTECGMDVRAVTLHSGICTEVFKQDLSQEREFCFVHLSFQEYLAALHVHHTFVSYNRNVLEQPSGNTFSRMFKTMPLFEFYKTAIDKALCSKNGHLDLVLRFLLGLSRSSTQEVLEGLLPNMVASQHPKEIISYIEKMMNEDTYPERCANLIHCLHELSSG